MTITGAAIGLVASLAAGRVVAPLLFETSPREPAVLAGVLLVLAAGALVGTLVPSRRALRVDPAAALRAE
jgi:putative ABC transport system permease protein